MATSIHGTAAPALTGDDFSDPGPISFSTRFTTSEAGTVTAIRYYVGTPATAVTQPNLNVALYDPGVSLSTGSAPTRTTAGWQEIPITPPLEIAPAGGPYIAVVTLPAAATASYGAISAPTVPRTVGALTVTAHGSGATPDGTNQASTSDFTVDVLVDGEPEPDPEPELQAITAASGWATAIDAADRLAALTDDDDATYVETTEDPEDEALHLTLPPMSRPAGDLTVPLRLSAVGGTATIAVDLLARDAGGLPVTIATASVQAVPGTPTTHAAVWTAAQLADTTGWDQGHQVRLTATAD